MFVYITGTKKIILFVNLGSQWFIVLEKLSYANIRQCMIWKISNGVIYSKWVKMVRG